MSRGSNNSHQRGLPALRHPVRPLRRLHPRQYARDVADFGLPLGIRFDHEMNGFWYPWAEQANGNEPGEYVADVAARARPLRGRGREQRHLDLGAEHDPVPAGPASEAQLYPGDDYVDWVGLSGYYRKVIPGKAASFTNTYGKSLDSAA